MAKKTLGYLELEWTCRSCGTRNPGTVESCRNCSAPMPEDATFELPVQQAISDDKALAERVASGADLICPYCGTRNPGDVEECSQCGGDLSDGARRESGQTIGAYDPQLKPPVHCPHCGAENPASATQCSDCGGPLTRELEPEPTKPKPVAQPARKRRFPVVLILLALLACAGIMLVLTSGSSETVAVVQDVGWSYTIELEQIVPVTREGWVDRIPGDAQVHGCTARVRQVLDEPVSGALEVCGTPYVVDTGTGVGQVVQDCEYHVSDDWCQYTIGVWQTVRGPTINGSDLSPRWPALSLATDEREAGRSEEYSVVLYAGRDHYTYHPRTVSEYRRFTRGSRWVITTNPLGGISSVEPAY